MRIGYADLPRLLFTLANPRGGTGRGGGAWLLRQFGAPVCEPQKPCTAELPIVVRSATLPCSRERCSLRMVYDCVAPEATRRSARAHRFAGLGFLPYFTPASRSRHRP